MSGALELYPALPELILTVGAMALLMIGAFGGERATGPALRYAMALLLLAGIAIVEMPDERVAIFNGSFVVDGFAKFFKALAVVGSIGTLWISGDFLADPDRGKFEYPVLILLATAGMLLLISAGDLIALYLGFELMSLGLYVVAAFDRDNVRSTEAGL